MSTHLPKPSQSTNWKKPAAVGYVTILLTFFGLGGWSASAPLDSAVVANGVVAVDNNRKTVQHYEGGIVREILVAEGQKVKEGEILFRLDPTQAQANLSMVSNQYRSTLAQEARLDAERDGKDEIAFPDEVLKAASEPLVAREIADQREQFEERKASLLGQIDILNSQVEQLKSEIGGLELEQQAAKSQIGYVQDQLADYQGLLDKKLIQKSAVVQLQREKANLEGIIGRSTAEIAKARSSMSEAELQKSQIKRKFLEDVNAQIVEVRQRAADLRQKIVVASDVFNRLVVKAPRSGTVQNLKVFTIGAVVRAGEPLLDIVPDNEALIIQAQVSPIDVDNVKTGMRAEVRLPSFTAKNLPSMFGEIRSISGDRLVNEQRGDSYFLALVEVDPSTLPEAVAQELKPGIPASVLIPTGERTVLEYIIDPFLDRMHGALREE